METEKKTMISAEETEMLPDLESLEEDLDLLEEDEEGQTKSGTTEKGGLAKVAPKDAGKLDMVIAFDTTGSMAEYIDAVRREVATLIPELFRDNEDLRLGVVAFGDYCDMLDARTFGAAFQCIMPTDDVDDLVTFINQSRNTYGGDSDEFYELVLKKIVEETPWREGADRSVLLIADANPHGLGYSYGDRVVDNRIDWREVARDAADRDVKVDTVTITDFRWFRELSSITGGVSVPFWSGSKTAELLGAAVSAKSSLAARQKFDRMMSECRDEEMKGVYRSYLKERMAK